MRLEELTFLQSGEGQQWLATLGKRPISDASHLQWAMKLRKAVGAAYAPALLETALLRQRAAKKFSRSAEMYFDRPGLEMSSAEIISTHRAQRFAPFSSVADLGCGIGGDAIGLAAVTNVVAVDRDPLRLAMAQANVTVYGGGDRFEGRLGDLVEMTPFSAEALFFDPARRTAQGKRIFRLADYQPPITLLNRWSSVTKNWGIKISPGFNYDDLPVQAHVEFISVQGELREAVLWYGALRSSARR
ncbi:MAG: SAM-dependent methyltransferase, partial [Candidatus Promineifilaceae bacterium]